VDALLETQRPDVVDRRALRPISLPEALDRAAIAVSAGTDRALLLPAFGALPEVQRRKNVRVTAGLRAALIAGERRLLSRTLNISTGGMLLVPAETFDVEDQVRFALALGETTVTGVGTVVRGTDDGARGLRFDDLDDNAELALSAFVARRQYELAEQLTTEAA
jgi:c-di-GMP-binding flagellar brake protein YcgR